MNRKLRSNIEILKILLMISLVGAFIGLVGTLGGIIYLFIKGFVVIAISSIIGLVYLGVLTFALYKFYEFFNLVGLEFESIALKFNDMNKQTLVKTNSYDNISSSIDTKKYNVQKSTNDIDDYISKLSCSKIIESSKYKDILLNYFQFMTIKEINDIHQYIKEDDYRDSMIKIFNYYIKNKDFEKINEIKPIILKYLNENLFEFYLSNNKKEYIINLINNKESNKILEIMNELGKNEDSDLLKNIEEYVYSYAKNVNDQVLALDILKSIINYKDSSMVSFKIALKNKLYQEFMYIYNGYFNDEFNKIIYDSIKDSLSNPSEWDLKMWTLIKDDIKNVDGNFKIDNFEKLEQQLKQNVLSEQLKAEMFDIIRRTAPNINQEEFIKLKEKYNEELFKKSILEVAKKLITDGKKNTAKIVLNFIFDYATSKKIIDENLIDNYLL